MEKQKNMNMKTNQAKPTVSKEVVTQVSVKAQ
jgi:hypothetical protein